jgi:thiamine-phosphate diphosphorylase
VTGLPRPCLMLVTAPTPRLTEIVKEAVAGGVDVVQMRDKRAAGHGLKSVYKGLTHALRGDTPVIVNADWQRAAGFGARHIHLPEKSAPVGVVRHHVGTGGLIGKSVHSVEAAVRAAESGADYLTAGTIFASLSHPDIEPRGLDFLREVCGSVPVPVLAIGGVTPRNAGDCLRAGAAGVAVLSAIMGADDPRDRAEAYRRALDAAWEEKYREERHDAPDD